MSAKCEVLQGWWWEREDGVLAPQPESGWAFTHACCAANILRNLAMEPHNLPALTGVYSSCTPTPYLSPSSKMELLTVFLWPALLCLGLHCALCFQAKATPPLNCPSQLYACPICVLTSKLNTDQTMSVHTCLCAWPTCCMFVHDNTHCSWLLTSTVALQGIQSSRPWSTAWLLAANSPVLTPMTWPLMPWTAFTKSQGIGTCCCQPCLLSCIQLCWQSCATLWPPMTPLCASG